uniref:Sodium/hydrogen exchanger 2 n=1 Tax=Zea mays TaxID=4577 RepID=A0A804QFT1_MAIZE
MAARCPTGPPTRAGAPRPPPDGASEARGPPGGVDAVPGCEATMGLGAAMALGDPPADYASIAAVGLFVALMCVGIIVGHLLEENRWMNESITTLFIGLGTRAVILFASSEKHSRVLVFIGTLISFTVISLGALGLISRLNIGALELGDYLALGAIFSATDSVCTLTLILEISAVPNY